MRDGKMIEEWSVPSWLEGMIQASANGQRCALFLDEISRAPLDVKQAALQLVLDKRIHQHELPTKDGIDTLIVAADNPDNGDYQVEPMDPALLDRFLSVEVEVDAMDWLKWAAKNDINKITRAYIADNQTKLWFQPLEGDDNNKVGATPRSWTKLSAYIDNIENIPREMHYPIIAGKIGKALASQFLNFMNNFQSMISVEDIEALVVELRKNSSKIETIGDGVRELISEIEATQKTELTNALVAKYIDGKVEDSYPMMAMLYALDVEISVSFLKGMASDDNDRFLRVAEFDDSLNKKRLFTRLIKDNV
jgi:hypothetical protein